MRPKNIKKNLSLNKKTIAHLNPREMKLMKGGAYTDYSCAFTAGCNTIAGCQSTYAACECTTTCTHLACTGGTIGG